MLLCVLRAMGRWVVRPRRRREPWRAALADDFTLVARASKRVGVFPPDAGSD